MISVFFKDRMTEHRDKFLVNKTNRSTGFQFYCYYESTCFGQPFYPSSGALSRTSALGHFMQFDGRLLAALMTIFYKVQDGTAVPFCTW